jgi:hypothetical protein
MATAINSKNKLALSFAFSFGLVGGSLHARKFKRLMRQAGYIYCSSPSEADIVIAHSAGCWLLPAEARPKLLLYVGMPLNQEQPFQTMQAAKHATIQTVRRWRRAKIRLKNTYYMTTQLRRNLAIRRMAKTAQPTILPTCQTVFIANRLDPWLKTAGLQIYVDEQDWAFINLPGAHGHIWVYPEQYIKLIDYYAALLA